VICLKYLLLFYSPRTNGVITVSFCFPYSIYGKKEERRRRPSRLSGHTTPTDESPRYPLRWLGCPYSHYLSRGSYMWAIISTSAVKVIKKSTPQRIADMHYMKRLLKTLNCRLSPIVQ
uniref:Uncharacterized protein n=1 Tax=Parascaris univalens TaxID=6257 RepID=A0A915BU35_PARUN